MRRLDDFRARLDAAHTRAQRALTPNDVLGAQLDSSREEEFRRFVETLPDRGVAWNDAAHPWRRLLPGPHVPGTPLYRPTKTDALVTAEEFRRQGKNHIYAEMLARRRFSASSIEGDTAVNFVIPGIVYGSKPYITDLVVIGDPKDAERMARVHLVKSIFYGNTNFLGEGVLSTRNVESWREQRYHLMENFLPLSSLAKVCPISVARARFAVENKIPEGVPTDLTDRPPPDSRRLGEIRPSGFHTKGWNG